METAWCLPFSYNCGHFSLDPLSQHNLFSHSERSTKVTIWGSGDGQCAVADTHSFVGRPEVASRTYNLAPRAAVQSGYLCQMLCLRRGQEVLGDLGGISASAPFPQPRPVRCCPVGTPVLLQPVVPRRTVCSQLPGHGQVCFGVTQK